MCQNENKNKTKNFFSQNHKHIHRMISEPVNFFYDSCVNSYFNECDCVLSTWQGNEEELKNWRKKNNHSFYDKKKM